ncbi:subtilisin-like protease [Agrocybe pediades]|nr:subtilisin-like protease [Agrocybe pediades]
MCCQLYILYISILTQTRHVHNSFTPIMKSALYWSLLSSFLSAGLVHGAVPISSVKQVTNVPTVPNKFIIEVDDLSDIPTKRSLTRSLDAVYESLRSRAIKFDVTKEFDSSGLFVGAALTLNSAQDVAAIASTPGVKSIRPVVRFDPPKPVKSHVVTGPNDAQVPPDGESTHILTGVDKLHAQGLIGTGIKIGIIDTGIDYTHPVLGGGIGPGHKVIGGFDFVGDAYNGTNTPMPDNDPLDQCNGHGTHVAGIIGANPGNEFNISGVAFGASISSYRVFGCSGSVTDDILVDALLRGVKEGQDILTLSLGGADGWTEGTATVVASRIAASGKIVTIAAGNDGSSGSWFTSGPGNGINVISAASLDNTVIPLQNLTVQGVQHDPITYFDTFPLPVLGNFPIFATSNDTTVVDDACNPLPASTPDLSKFVVVVRRGTCSFVQKLTNIAAKGGNLTLIYDNGNGFSDISVGNFQAVLIQPADGEFLVQQFVKGAPITVSFPQVGGAFNFPDPAGGLISSFTSYGPTNDMFFKPAVAAPGGNIISTFPVPLGSFAVLSGTSMATPFIAGSSALLLAAKGKTAAVAKSARDLFETTAQPIGSSKTDGDPLQTLTQQGAGLINVFSAIHTTTIVSPGELILNDTANFKPIQTFTVKNTGKTLKKFKLSHVPAGTALTVEPGTIFASDGPVPLSSTAASVTIIPNTLILLPGQSQTVLTTFKPPTGLDPSTFPVFSGFIQIAGPTAADTAHVSYLGLQGSLKNKQVIDDTDEFFGVPTPALLDAAGDVQSGPVNYTFVGDDVPTLVWRLAFGTPAFRADLVSSNINFKPTITSRSFGNFGPFFTFPSPHNGGTFAQVKIVGPLAEFDFVSRNNDDTTPGGEGSNSFVLETPTFANGTTIPNGSYRVLIRALRVTGDPKNEADYESWLSPVLGIQASPSKSP